MEPTPQQLFSYALGHYRRVLGQGGGGLDLYPTFRATARRLSCSISTIERVADDARDLGMPVDIVAGFATGACIACLAGGDIAVEVIQPQADAWALFDA